MKDIMRYTIVNTTSGLNLGTFEGSTPFAAYCAMMDDAGGWDMYVRALRDEAHEAGDEEQVALCTAALRGNADALSACKRTIYNGQGDIEVKPA